MDDLTKAHLYTRLEPEIDALIGDLADPVAAMASVACVIKEALPYASWVGFYRVVAPDLLRVGPYQGPLGCLEIPFHRGVCGAAARTGETQLVPDVHAFPGHIACDDSALSEIVVPVRDTDGLLVAVMDLDSRQPAAFSEADRAPLERIAQRLGKAWRG
ncbi:MAG: GAF domain-containing protein [Thermoanaerobaculia bacterium]|nr:GAF domain-containing protein [Thermoanaerobaculia bacterium]